jgi:hypothetical protein
LLLTTWVMGRRAPLVLVGPPGTRTMVDHLLAAWQEDIRVRTGWPERGQRMAAATVREAKAAWYDSAGVRITAVRVPHGEWKVCASLSFAPRHVRWCCPVTRHPAMHWRTAAGADVLVHETYPSVRLKPENRPGGDEWPAYMHSVHTSDVEVGALAAKAGVKLLVLSHIVRMGGTDPELLAGVRQGGYRGPVRIAKDLDRYETRPGTGSLAVCPLSFFPHPSHVLLSVSLARIQCALRLACGRCVTVRCSMSSRTQECRRPRSTRVTSMSARARHQKHHGWSRSAIGTIWLNGPNQARIENVREICGAVTSAKARSRARVRAVSAHREAKEVIG